MEVSFQLFIAETVFHTFWTDVGSIDLYRQGVKDDILARLNTLKKAGVTSDWMIIVVETPEKRKGNKFPLRATVLDKLKQDVVGRTPDKCVALTDPSKADSRAAESMQALLQKFRQFFLQSYKLLKKYEENIRIQKRKGPGLLGTLVNISYCRSSLPLCMRIWVSMLYLMLSLPSLLETSPPGWMSLPRT